MDFKILSDFAIAAALGALIGSERQRGKKTRNFAGIRTFIIISFLGALSGFFYQQLDYPFLFPLLLVLIAILVAISYATSTVKGFIGITAEISTFVVYLLGFLCMFEDYRIYALIFGVAMTFLLSFKQTLHKFIEGAKEVEWNDTLKFTLIAFVILPILPETINIGVFDEKTYGNLNVFYPREIWMLIVFICGISFIGYFLVKIFGERKGSNIVGAMGGLVSSTAVTQSMAHHSKAKTGTKLVTYGSFVSATLLATLVSFIRAAVISAGINADILPILIPLGTVFMIGSVVYIFLNKKKSEIHTKLNLESPFKLRPALILGGLYAVLIFASKACFAMQLGWPGLVITSTIAGLFDIDPVILIASNLSVQRTITPVQAISAILISISSNLLAKSFIAVSSGSKIFGKTIAKIFLALAIIILVWILYLQII